MLTNAAVWSPDSRWIVYDVRSTADGAVFDGNRVERVDVETGRVEILYESGDGACCGVVTCSPVDDRVVFILGPTRPTPDWSYAAARRQGVTVRTTRPGLAENLDARDLVSPFTPGSLRGGSHVHLFSPDAALVSFTYEDAVLDSAAALPGRQHNLRGVGISICGLPVHVPRGHPRNHDGSAFSVLVTRLTDHPRPGSDEISRAFEESWIGSDGYLRPDGSRQRRAIAFQGHVVTRGGETISEVFVVDLPDDPGMLTQAADEPLAGTIVTRPAVPRGVSQRRLTHTADRRHPGIQGPRHWLRSSPDGSRIATLMRDDAGIVQLFTCDSNGGEPVPLTRNPWDISGAFTWSPDGRWIACIGDGSVWSVDAAGGSCRRLTARVNDASGPRPEACVFSPDGRRIAFMRHLPASAAAGRSASFNQIFVVDADA
jgi:Tol biopolymer transport system component